MNRDEWYYQCQEDNGDETDDDRWIHPEEVPEDDGDEDEEMDEM